MAGSSSNPYSMKCKSRVQSLDISDEVPPLGGGGGGGAVEERLVASHLGAASKPMHTVVPSDPAPYTMSKATQPGPLPRQRCCLDPGVNDIPPL